MKTIVGNLCLREAEVTRLPEASAWRRVHEYLGPGWLPAHCARVSCTARDYPHPLQQSGRGLLVIGGYGQAVAASRGRRLIGQSSRKDVLVTGLVDIDLGGAGDAPVLGGSEVQEDVLLQVRALTNTLPVQRPVQKGKSPANAGLKSLDESTDVADEVIEICRQRMSEDSSATFLFYLYKPKGDKCMTEYLKRHMTRNGLNLAEQLPSGERRFVFETWGRHEGINGHEGCTTVVLVGIQQRDHISLAGMVKAQSRDLDKAVDPSTIKRMLASEVAHATYQALSRGSCRRVTDGVASPMKVFLLHKDLGLKGDLETVMPGIKWSCKDPEFLPVARGGMGDDLALRIAKALVDLPATQSTISTSKLKQALQIPMGDAMKRMFSRAASAAADTLQGWTLQGRSFVRA